MGGRAGRAITAWISENTAAAAMVALVVGIGGFCISWINQIPLLAASQEANHKAFLQFKYDHAQWGDGINASLESHQEVINEIQRVHAGQTELLRIIELTMRDLRDEVIRQGDRVDRLREVPK